MIAYFDTSALVKLVHDESGSEIAHKLWLDASHRVSAVLVCAEGRSALAAAKRVGRLGVREERRAVDELHDVIGNLTLIDVDRELATTAGSLAAQHALRGYDAVHLASASTLRAAEPIFVSWDRSLSRAARAEQLITLPA